MAAGARSAAPASPSLLDPAFGAPGRSARRLAAAWQTLALGEITHARPDWGIASVVVDGGERPVVEEVDRADAVRDAAPVQQGRRAGAAAGAGRRADVGPLRDAAARHRAHAAARPRRLRHRLAQRPRRAALGRPLRPRRVHRSHDRLHGGARPGRERRRDLPALRRRARRGRDHGRGRSPGAAGEPDADGRADRLPHRPDGGQQAGDEQADRLVREEPDRPRAMAAEGRRPARLPRLPAAERLHRHEPRAPRRGVPQVLRPPRRRRGSRGEGDRATSTTSTWRSPISRPTSTSRPCVSSSRNTRCRSAS